MEGMEVLQRPWAEEVAACAHLCAQHECAEKPSVFAWAHAVLYGRIYPRSCVIVCTHVCIYMCVRA